MPFSQPNQFTVTVTAADISASEVSLLNLSNNLNVNSLAKCLQRLHFSNQLPGEADPETPNPNIVIRANTTLAVTGASETLVATCLVFCILNNYVTDTPTAIKIALENVSAIKPTAPYTVTLTLAT